MANEEVPAYIGRCKCGAIRFTTVDKPEYAKDNAKEIAKCIRAGLIIERVTVGYVRATPWGDCTCCKKATEKECRKQQGNLFPEMEADHA